MVVDPADRERGAAGRHRQNGDPQDSPEDQ
jgi:hypothetical protein